MKLSKDQKGFSFLPVVLMVGVLIAVGAISYNVFNKNTPPKASINQESVQPTKDPFSNPERVYLPSSAEVKSTEEAQIKPASPVEAPPKDPKKLVGFGQPEGQEYYGFSFKYPETWTIAPCIDKFVGDTKSYHVWLEPDGKDLPGCTDYQQASGVRIQVGNYYYPEYDAESDKKADGVYQKEVTYSYVTLNNKEVLRKRTIWSGQGSLFSQDTVTVDYKYHYAERMWWAGYKQKVGDTDHLEEFENLVKSWVF